jgi:hypothetical protein
MPREAPLFDQRDQIVHGDQYNVAGDLHIGSVRNKEQLAGELDKLAAEPARALRAKALDKRKAVAAERHLKAAAREAKKKSADKSQITKCLKSAGTIVKGVKTAVALSGGITQAIDAVKNLF